MSSEFHLYPERLDQDAGGRCHPVHAAGIRPNGMNRFLHSNAQEVLFVY